MAYVDTFNRADEFPLASPWASAEADSPPPRPNLVSNEAKFIPGDERAWARYTGQAFTPNQWAQITWTNPLGNCGPAVRMSYGVNAYLFSVHGPGTGPTPPFGVDSDYSTDGLGCWTFHNGALTWLWHRTLGGTRPSTGTLKLWTTEVAGGKVRVRGFYGGSPEFDFEDDGSYGGIQAGGLPGFALVGSEPTGQTADNFECGGDLKVQADATAKGIPNLFMRLRPGAGTKGQAYFRMVDSWMGHGVGGPLKFGGPA